MESGRRALRLRSARDRLLIRPSLLRLPTPRRLGVTAAVSAPRTGPETSPESLIVSFDASSRVKPDLQRKEESTLVNYAFNTIN